MLWFLTRWNHRLSTTRLVRWWLRMTVLDRFILVSVCNFLFFLFSLFAIPLWLLRYAGQALSEMALSSKLGAISEAIPAGLKMVQGLLYFISGVAICFEVIFLIIVAGLTVFFVVDWIWDYFGSRLSLGNFTSKKNIILATRGEYMGGHPNLPHARFIYLIISGTKTNPYLGLILPAVKPIQYNIPLVDVTGTESGVDNRFGRPGIFNLAMTSVSPSVWRGSRTAINIEYLLSGRKYIVEVGCFLRGNDEVQMWKNFLICTRAEADTGEKPFGHWKSLPENGKEASSE